MVKSVSLWNCLSRSIPWEHLKHVSARHWEICLAVVIHMTEESEELVNLTTNNFIMPIFFLNYYFLKHQQA